MPARIDNDGSPDVTDHVRRRNLCRRKVDLEANAVFRPTLQAILSLSELIATTTLRKEKVTKKGPRCDQAVTTRAMHDIVAQAQVVLDQEKADLVSVMVVMTRILILVWLGNLISKTRFSPCSTPNSVTFLAGHGENLPPTWVIHMATRRPAHNTPIHMDFSYGFL